MRAALLALALVLPAAAEAHDPRLRVQFDPAYAWFDGPGHRGGADGRVRIVPQPRHGQAALTVNQFDAYQHAYRRYMARFTMRMPVLRADARARHAAWHEIVSADRRVPVQDLDLTPLRAGEQPLGIGF